MRQRDALGVAVSLGLHQHRGVADVLTAFEQVFAVVTKQHAAGGRAGVAAGGAVDENLDLHGLLFVHLVGFDLVENASTAAAAHDLFPL